MNHSDTLSVAGQIAIFAVTVLTCVGSTVGLEYLSHPYVARLFANKDKEGHYFAERLNIYGNKVLSEVDYSKIAKTNAFQHPFSNFVHEKNYYYVDSNFIQQEDEKEKFQKKLL